MDQFQRLFVAKCGYRRYPNLLFGFVPAVLASVVGFCVEGHMIGNEKKPEKDNKSNAGNGKGK